MKVLFVTGTDTGVGKSMVAAALASALRLQGVKTGVMKPISCGGTEDASLLMEAAGVKLPMNVVNPIALKQPLSPNVGAKMERVTIDLTLIDRAVKKMSDHFDVLVVEGCGGLLVPIDDKNMVVDLIPRLRSKAILVSRSGLGAINHSLLSLEALRHRGIQPLGVIFNRLKPGSVSIPEKTNPDVVSKFGRAANLGTFPFIKDCGVDCLGKAFIKHIDLEKILC